MSGYDSDKVNKQSPFLWYFILFLMVVMETHAMFEMFLIKSGFCFFTNDAH